MEIMNPFRDLLMEGLSAKLKSFEDVSNTYLIKMEPRLHYASALMEQNKLKQMNTSKNLGMLKSNLLNKNPNIQKTLEDLQHNQELVDN